MAAKEIRSLNRVNETTGNTEIFYPATTTDAVVHPEKRKSITDVVDDDMVEIGSPVVDHTDIRQIKNKGEVFYPLTHVDAIVGDDGDSAIDSYPTAGSGNLVSSGGIHDFVLNNAVYDISLAKATGGVLAEYADLSAALGTNGANVPADIRRGGMSVKFVQSNDHKYVQWRLMLSTFTTAQFANTANWQSMNSDAEPTAGSKNLVESNGVDKYISTVCKNSKSQIVDKNLTINPTDFEQGGYIYGDKQETLNKLRSKFFVPIQSGTNIVYNSGGLELYFAILETIDSPRYIYFSGWLSGSGVVKVNKSGYLHIQVRKNDGSELDVTNYNGTIRIDFAFANEIYNRTCTIESPINFSKSTKITILADDIEQGGYLYAKKVENNTRIRCKNLIFVEKGDFISCVNGTNTIATLIIMKEIESDSYLQISSSSNLNEHRSLIFTEECGYLAITIRKPNDSSIDVSDYDCSISIEKRYNSRISDCVNHFDGIVGINMQIGMLDIDGTIQSGWSKRAATIPIPMPSNIIYITGFDVTKYRVQSQIYVSGTRVSIETQTALDNATVLQCRLPDNYIGSNNITFGFTLVNKTDNEISSQELENINNNIIVTSSLERIKGKTIRRYQFGGDGNDWCFVRTPLNYDPDRKKPFPFVICNHGNGWNMDNTPEKMNWTKRTMYVPLDDSDYIANPTQYNGTSDSTLWYSNPTIEALLSAGYVVCGCENYGDNLYGNENCRKACASFYEHIIKTYNVEKRCCMIGASNGAQTSINAAYLLGDKVKAMILQYPLTCLVNHYENYSAHQAPIRAAYEITDTSITENELISATRTHDLLHTDMVENKKIGYFPPTKLYYSEDDAVVNYQYNALAMFNMLDASLKIVEKVQCSGGHGDYSHFNPSQYVDFFNKY